MIEEKFRLEEIKDLSRRGEDHLVEDKLLSYLEDYPDSLIASHMLGGLYFNQNEYELAELYLNKVLNEKPLEPSANHGMYHILWDTDRKEAAMNLIDAFLKGVEQNDHKISSTVESFLEIKEECIEKGVWST